ncbi:MAG: PQQ-like beta-propeller repeat protein [Planctomycetaceae bacterium]|nr:PQQ-like beta-propeller repeat protein [Planctomycetaceae bacterium]
MMTRMPSRFCHSVVAHFAVSCLLALGIARADDRPAPQRQSVSLDVPLLVSKQFASIRGLIEQEDWVTALAALRDVQAKFPDALVTAAPGRYVNVTEYARSLIAELPEAGRAAHRQQIDGWAERQFAAALDAQSEVELQKLLKEAPASSYTSRTLWTLGEWQWERGDPGAARRTWEQLLPIDDRDAERAPTPASSTAHDERPQQIRPSDVRARLVLCSLAELDFPRAASELEEFRTLHPDDAGFLAGRTGLLHNILAELLKAAQDGTQAATGADWTTFARDRRRSGAIGASVSLGGPQWMIPLEPLEVPHWERGRTALPGTAPAGRYPVAVDGGLFVHDGVTIRAMRLADGRPLWPVEEATDVGKIYPPFNVLPPRPVLRPGVGVPRFTLTVQGNRLYALTGPSVLTLPEAGLHASPTRLVCLEIGEGQGLLRWFQVAEELFAPGWMMTGTPIATDDLLYLPLLRTSPQMELAVACLSAERGTVVWQRSIGQALVQPLAGRVEFGHQLLTMDDERLYFSTDHGVVAAIDAATGVIHWAVTYPSRPPAPLARSDESTFGLLPPVCDHGRLFVKPNDSDELLALDATSGTTLWKQRLPSRIVHLLGVRGTQLFVSGDHLWCLDATTGDIRWRFGFDDPAGYGFGQGAIAGDRVYWTTREELYVVNESDGRTVQRYPLQQLLGISGGHLLLSEDRLIIAGINHLTAFRLSPRLRSDGAAFHNDSDSPK